MEKSRSSTRLWRTLLIALGSAFLLYHSIYFQALDAVRAQDAGSVNTDEIVEQLLRQLPEVPAVEVSVFLDQYTTDFDALVTSGHQLGISKRRYFMLEGAGTVIEFLEEDMVIQLLDRPDQIRIAVDFIFGNTVREASGLVSISDYENTMDFNNISVGLNQAITRRMVQIAQSGLAPGDTLEFKGAVRINLESPGPESLRVIPILLQKVQ